MEFHVSRIARDRYQFDDSLFGFDGRVIFTNFAAARAFAGRINAARARDGGRQVLPAQLNALGLLDELAHALIQAYREAVAPGALADARAKAVDAVGEAELERVLLAFCEQFPTLDVYRNRLDVRQYLQQSTDGRPNRDIALEEMLLLSLTNQNAAAEELRELFDDSALRKSTRYGDVISSIERHFDTLPPAADGQSLITLLRLPLLLAGGSLHDQLQSALERWRPLLNRGAFAGRLLNRAEIGIDFVREEDAFIFNQQQMAHAQTEQAWHAPQDATAMPPQFDTAAGRTLAGDGDGVADAEPEQFTPDRDWMPRLVLMAKSTYVWLDQLSKKYKRAITQLDQIPDEELEQLQRWGITGLWLIGLWERSIASQTIKRMMGNHDAVASAYSLHSYDIAQDLGGWDALARLRERAWQRGIRLASDMVPNHVGIDGAWVGEHPDWFLQAAQSPYPNYTFNGPDLSRDARISVRIEDHYWDRSDAAVVFKLHDHRDGRDRYVYHGNDGTSTPWNDTAQLNYLNPELREAVIQTILHVARNFPIIRFDAAMTLAKRHIQRLWFPQPGQANSIPSRNAFGMTRAQLDAIMPHEFWREVVERAAVEAPDTLLLAEAFWMMEGYFVRTLGMHRVYNSAFMIMLRNEENEGYRKVIKDTLAFDPQILRRYVNFMNNPDEKTAAEQFGRGEKYFGVAAMLATLPGLPMVGHGQFEGFSEKYGMEFKRAMRDEPVDWGLLQHHERVIVPLLKRRPLFAEVEHFTLFDFVAGGGATDENVFCYTNRAGNERGLFIFNNCTQPTAGALRVSSEIKQQFEHDPEEGAQAAGGARRRITLAQALDVSDSPSAYLIYRDQFSGQEHVRSCRELHEHGLALSLKGYECHVWVDMRVEMDTADGDLAALCAQLGGRGVDSVQQALMSLRTDDVADSEQPAGETKDQTSIAHRQFGLVVHATHEAGIKLGGIGAVLDGLLSAPGYLEGVKRTILVGPMHTNDRIEMERLFSQRNKVAHFHYFADRGLISCPPELAARLSGIEQRYGVRICYARKQFGDPALSATSAQGAVHEVLMLDVSDMPSAKAADFKFGVWEKFGLDSGRYEGHAEYNEYMKLATPAFEALQAVVQLADGAWPPAAGPLPSTTGQQPPTIVCHEFMGLPLWYAAELAEPGRWRSAYLAHEVPAARGLVEQSSGHDTRFYNAMRSAAYHGLNLDSAFGDQNGYFKHAMLKTAARCNRVLAVSDVTAEELHFVDRAFRRKGVRVAYNGVPARRISLAEKRASMHKLDLVMHELAGFEPTFVFTHVSRLVTSKAFWRDLAVMRQLDPLLAQRGETAIYLAVATSQAAGRSPADAQRMAREYGWPTYHRLGWPDLVDAEAHLWRAISTFNGNARASRVLLINQFGFDSAALGGSIPQGVNFSDLRIGTDLEFGQSIYEPFGIAQLEPLTYGALCVISDACGCRAIADGRLPMADGAPSTTGHQSPSNVIIGNYTRLPYMADLRGALNVGQWERDDVERRVAWDVANAIVQRLPRSDAEREALIESGHALASSLSWDVVARRMFLPGLG